MRNSTIDLRDPSFCFQLNLTAVRYRFDLSDITRVDRLLKVHKDRNISEVFEDRLSNYTKNISQLIYTDLDSVSPFIKSLDTSITDDNHFLSLLYATTMVITNIVRMENSVGSSEDKNRNNWGLIDEYTLRVINTTTLPLIKINQFLTDKSVDYQMLARQIAALLCAQLNVKLFNITLGLYSTDSLISVEIPCSPSNAYFIGNFAVVDVGPLLCMRGTNSGIFHFQGTNTVAGLSFDSKSFYVDGYVADQHFVVLDFKGRFGSNNLDYSLATTQGSTAVANTMISGHYVSVSLKRKPCSYDHTYYDCRMKCRAELIQQQCGCSPVSVWIKTSLKYSICGTAYGNVSTTSVPFISEGKCVNLTATGLQDSACNGVCHENCETLMLSHTTTQYINKTILFDRNALYIQKLTTFTYPLVTESLAMDVNNLITSLGGNLSLWLGASFLAIIHIIVFFCKIPFERCFPKTKPPIIVAKK